MSESDDTQIPYGPMPFDHAKADIILRSSDNVDFRVFKLFLSLASPFFETLFDVPQPAEGKGNQETRDGLAVIPVTEDSKTLDALLRFCYPCTLAEDPNIEELKDAIDVLEAARKYSLDAIEKKARQAISNPKILEKEPLRCFAIARRGRLREETLLAAKYTLTQPLIPLWFQEIDLLTATDLLSLLTYHKRCGEAVYELRTDLSWITSHYGSAQACSWLAGQYQQTSSYGDESALTCSRFGFFGGVGDGYGNDYDISYQTTALCNCTCPRSNSVTGGFELTLLNTGSLKWWEDFMEETFKELQDKPCKEIIQAHAEKTVQVVKARDCQSCSQKISEGMRDFVDLFTRKVEEAVLGVPYSLPF